MKQQLNEVKRLQELAGVVGEEEHNYLEDLNPIDDVPSVKLDIDDKNHYLFLEFCKKYKIRPMTTIFSRYRYCSM